MHTLLSFRWKILACLKKKSTEKPVEMCYFISIPEVGKGFKIFWRLKTWAELSPRGVLNFYFGIGVLMCG